MPRTRSRAAVASLVGTRMCRLGAPLAGASRLACAAPGRGVLLTGPLLFNPLPENAEHHLSM